MRDKKEKKKDGWFFSRSLLNEINEISEGVEEKETPETTDSSPVERELPGKAKESVKNKAATSSETSKKETDKAEEVKELEELEELDFPTLSIEKEIEKLGIPESPSIRKDPKENDTLKEKIIELEQANQELLDNQASFSVVIKRLMKQKDQVLEENKRILEANRKNSEMIQRQESLEKQQQAQKILQLEQELEKQQRMYKKLQSYTKGLVSEAIELNELRKEKEKLKKAVTSVEGQYEDLLSELVENGTLDF
ncbi:hypothetical protein [Enterococcus sp. DIV0800]|uniref:hypothetical protein n=1 Tax=unclassified Enterococcus TaxID=2608891 RepID=UPI003D300C66